ncbi:hypothetical protein [Luteipulveratus flavus]|uniref:Uncharacterized protein n=1 Tax=Luteipulveratus flavus TaxID=3031728 RepID=A0ABT6C9K7_9MICO|nr:hypothetical protein [Luteipulveratus sp. YIM 133296]MDF8265597.1 hypothetical protein [Luteipulveratus sp. YIM 133296]
MTYFDQAWIRAVKSRCDETLQRADVGFTAQDIHDEHGAVTAIMWQANPQRYAERYPDSAIVDSYGSQWPEVRDINCTLKLDESPHAVGLAIEGWGLPEVFVRVDQRGDRDGVQIANLLSRIFAVPNFR